MNDPLGGQLINRECPQDSRDDKRAYGKSLPSLQADRNAILDVEKIANGTFSPLTGFMGSKDVQAVLDTMHRTDGIPWTIPIVFHAPKSDTAGLKPGDDVAIVNTTDQTIAAILTIDEVFSIDKSEFAQKVYGTTEREHPGVNLMMNWGDSCVAGSIELIEYAASLIPGNYDLSPAQVRKQFAEKGWHRIVGFQTRNLGHRAHEHLQKIALEHADGLLIHPLIGWKKKGDMQPEVILEGYEILTEKYYVKDNTMLAGLTTAMRYAGPKEAVFHSIIRKNFGCTHFIVGRDHAGVGSYYEKYAGHKIFDEFGDELGITPMRLHGPCWCEVCQSIVTEHTCPHEDAWLQISGTDVRAMLARGECPPPSVMRPEIGAFLVQKAKEDKVFFEG